MRIAPIVPLLVLLSATAAHAVKPLVPISACGDVVPRGAIGYLTGDLTCPFSPSNPPGVIFVSRGARLELRGYAIYGDFQYAAVICGEMYDRPGLPPALTLDHGRCEVDGGGGYITGSEGGIMGSRMRISNVTIEATKQGSVYCDKTCRLEHVTILASGADGIGGRSVTLLDTTVSGSAESGVGTRSARAQRSVVTGNGTAPACASLPLPQRCVDFATKRRPGLRQTQCETSRPWLSNRPRPLTWGVCSLD